MSSTTNKEQQAPILNWASKDGEFRRQQSVFRDWIKDEPNAKFAPEPYVFFFFTSFQGMSWDNNISFFCC